MRTAPRVLARELVSRLAGDRRLPVGGVARDRRLLRRALRDREPGAVLAIGTGVAVRQVLPLARVDVAGVIPHLREVTVCSRASGAGSLPPGRWDTIVVTEPGADLAARLAAAVPAARPRGRLLVLDRHRWTAEDPEPRALRAVGDVVQVVGRGAARVWVTELGA